MMARDELIYILSAIHRQKVLDHKFPEWPNGVEVRAMTLMQHVDVKSMLDELNKAIADGSVKKYQTVNGFIYTLVD